MAFKSFAQLALEATLENEGKEKTLKYINEFLNNLPGYYRIEEVMTPEEVKRASEPRIDWGSIDVAPQGGEL